MNICQSLKMIKLLKNASINGQKLYCPLTLILKHVTVEKFSMDG